jgi:hypothetical protein
MALSTTTSQVEYFGTNTTNQVCPVPFRFFEETDLEVSLLDANNEVTVLPVESYIVLGTDTPSGGSVMILSPVPTTTKIAIVRNVPETQLVSFTTGDRLPASTIERALDKVTMLVQEVARGVAKSLRFTDVVTTQPPLTPVPASVLGTDENNQISFTPTAPATGAAPFFLAAPSAGAVPTFIPLPGITTDRLVDLAVTTGKIADKAVIPEKIGGNPTFGQYVLGSAGGIVGWLLPSTTALEDDAVITPKLLDGAVTTPKLEDNAVTDAKLSASTSDDALRAVTTSHIRNNAVTANKLRSSDTDDALRAVTTNHFRDLSVTTGKLADNSVTSLKLASSATTDADRAVTSNHLRDGAVTGSKLAENAVTFRELAAGAAIQFTAVTIGGRPVTNANIGATFTLVPTTATGIEVGGLDFTPRMIGSTLLLRFTGYVVTDVACHVGFSIFQGTTLLRSFRVVPGAANWSAAVAVEVVATSASLTSQRFTVRMYKIANNTTTTYARLNGFNGSELGPSSASLFTITEFK